MINGFFRFFEKIILRYMRQRQAAIMPMVAILLPVIIGVVGMGVDFGSWMQDRHNLQTAADASAIAAAYEVLYGDEDSMDATALREAEKNGFFYDTGEGSEITVNYVPGIDGSAIGSTVEVILRQPTNSWFSSLFLNSVFINSVAGVNIERPNDFCMLSLSEDADAAIEVQGNAAITAPGCSIAANSSSDRALLIRGNSDIDVGDVYLAGDYDTIGNSSTFNYGDMNRDAEPLPDPYADLEVPSFDTADCETFTAPADGVVTNSDPTGNTPRIFCGSNINLGNTTDWTIEPGTYILNGVDLNITGSGTVTSDGATFIFTGNSSDGYGQLDVTGGGSMTFTAPTDESNPWAGIVFFQDRDAPYISNSPNRLSGTSDLILNGVAYFPSQPLVFGGNNTAQVPACSMVIASTISLTGTPNMDTSCDGIPVEHIDPPRIVLAY